MMPSVNAHYVVIGRWDDPSSRTLTLQDFVIDGRSTIPVFSDEASFKQQTLGTPYEREGLVIDGELLLSLLKDDDLLILDPASARPATMDRAQFAALVQGAGGLSNA